MTQWTPNHDNHPDCVICKLPILPTQDDPYSQGFDAEPIAAGRCCDVCNKQVIASVTGNLMVPVAERKPISVLILDLTKHGLKLVIMMRVKDLIKIS